ncbi:MAG TPA: PEP/pyruvate-binding domain-containing protein [Vicinamibacteria bacterium]|nr:PEP/pyruvate-binding domain-containing protein [Vicinamibacteria bacterium]
MSTQGRQRFSEYQSLMRHRVMDILLASTPYDTFILDEAGELSERMLGEFRNLDLHYAPGLTGVASGEEALRIAREQHRVNLIITTPHLADMNAAELARRVKAEGLDVPVVLLAWDTRELSDFQTRFDTSAIERTFLWQGDARILVAIVKSVEDRRNARHDTDAAGVQVILLVEDNVRYYSSFLPVMYTELLHHSQRVIREGLNLSQMILRMRARPKILLCTTWEEAEEAFRAYGDDVLGIISDVEFPREGQKVPQAGADFAREVRAAYPDVPIVLHSSRPENEALAKSVGADFLLKGSPLLLQELREVMLEHFGFGEFVFRTPDGVEADRAADLRQLEEKLATVPEASLAYHAERNHFSRWLKARTEFALAHELRPRRLGDYPSVEGLRRSLIESIAGYRLEQARTLVTDFDRGDFDLSGDFYRMGGGSLGGKARGLAFVRRLLAEQRLRDRFPGIEVAVPISAVLGTDVFDGFLDDNDLRWFAIECEDEEEIERRFLAARFPVETAKDVAAFLDRARWPLAVRSSSLLEDSQHQPFTGVYDTLMLANDSWSLGERTSRAIQAIKRVYASTFSRHAKGYLKATPYRLEEEKMAIILQRVVGATHGARFYPDFSGVARSHNFYPSPPMSSGDGIVAVALGMGRAIVEGGACLRFCPRFPRHILQFSCVADVLETTQSEFWALPLDGTAEGMRERAFLLEAAEADGTLAAVASTYSPEDDAVFDGLSRPGPRLVTFAPVLKHGLFPLAEITATLMEAGERGMGAPVEIEFAVSLHPAAGHRADFGFVQMRPLALTRESEALELGEVEEANVLCRSQRVLGNGRIEGIRDLVVVDFQRFERSRSREAAAEVARLNGHLLAAGTPYALVGVGRWGSRDPWLGIPVTWDQVCGAQVIVEAGLRDLKVTPSQGTHFFQNLTSFNVGYFTVNPDTGDGVVDWTWLDAQPSLSAAAHVRHIRLDRPLLVLMNGKKNEGLILKPAP